MATKTIQSGIINDDTGISFMVTDPIPPFLKGIGEYNEELVVGTDFTSGDDIVLQFQGSDKILFASFMTDVGAVKGFVEANIAGAVGKQLTISNVTTNLKCLVRFNI